MFATIFNLNSLSDSNIKKCISLDKNGLGIRHADSFSKDFLIVLLKALFFFTLRPSIWILLDIPVDRYRAIFLKKRINNLIDSLRIKTDAKRIFHVIECNSFRTWKIQLFTTKEFYQSNILFFMNCFIFVIALLLKSNRDRALCPIIFRNLSYVPDNGLLNYWYNFWHFHHNAPFNTYKVLIQIHEHSSKEGRQQLHNNDWFWKL